MGLHRLAVSGSRTGLLQEASTKADSRRPSWFSSKIQAAAADEAQGMDIFKGHSQNDCGLGENVGCSSIYLFAASLDFEFREKSNCSAA